MVVKIVSRRESKFDYLFMAEFVFNHFQVYKGNCLKGLKILIIGFKVTPSRQPAASLSRFNLYRVTCGLA